MISIREVKTRKEIKDFILFPIKLYKGNEYYVPELYGDVKKLFSKKNANNKIAKSVFYLAYQDNKVVGRIQGIIQYQSIEKYGFKKARFTRIHFINDINVAKALLEAVESWAKNNGMDGVIGPLGYDDLQREGLLIEGFDQLSTFEEEYNYDYYQKYIEELGYSKDVDWVEFKIMKPDKPNEKIDRIFNLAMKVNKLHVASREHISNAKYIKKYRDGFFHVLDEAYSKLYGTVPISKEAQDALVKQFKQVLDKRFLMFICDEEENVIAFALCFPSLSKVFRRTNGKLTPLRILKLFKAVKHPEVIDMGLVGILPEYQARGISALIVRGLEDFLNEKGITHAETNLNLETNQAILSHWKYFNNVNHKRRRCYVKMFEK